MPTPQQADLGIGHNAGTKKVLVKVGMTVLQFDPEQARNMAAMMVRCANLASGTLPKIVQPTITDSIGLAALGVEAARIADAARKVL